MKQLTIFFMFIFFPNRCRVCFGNKFTEHLSSCGCHDHIPCEGEWVCNNCEEIQDWFSHSSNYFMSEFDIIWKRFKAVNDYQSGTTYLGLII